MMMMMVIFCYRQRSGCRMMNLEAEAGAKIETGVENEAVLYCQSNQ